MKERPILFSGEMVRAILEGRKTQTRRVVKAQAEIFHTEYTGVPPNVRTSYAAWPTVTGKKFYLHCRYGEPGDRLWVRETWQSAAAMNVCHPNDDYVVYAATDPDWKTTESWRWRSGIHMPRWASRITLEVTDVRVERLQSISEEDARAEGCEGYIRPYPDDDPFRPVEPEEEYRELWDRINGKKCPWSSNPWVWVVTFKRLETEASVRA